MRVLVIGSVESTRVCLRALKSASADVGGVVTLPPDLAHRHSDFIDLAPDAAELGAELIFAPNCNTPEIVERCTALSADYLFVVGWSQICRPPLIATGKKGAIGYHPAPLPRMRGRAIIPWTILLDEKITGDTLFWIDEGVDTGAILAQSFIHVAPDETATTLYERHMANLGNIMREAIAGLQSEQPHKIIQDERYATYCARRTAADGKIDWTKPAREVDRLIRAVARPYPGAFTGTPKGKLTLWASSLTPALPQIFAMTGQIVAREPGRFAVRCGDGVDLWITDFGWPDEAAKTDPPPLHAMLA